jgi:hypothetical protein
MLTYLVHKSCFIKTCFPDKWTRRPTSLPQLSHRQQILNVIAKQLIEELLAIIVSLQCPCAFEQPLHSLPYPRQLVIIIRHILGIFAIGRNCLVGVLGTEQLIEQVLGPHDTVNWLGRCVSDCAAGKGRRLRQAVVALGHALPDQGRPGARPPLDTGG